MMPRHITIAVALLLVAVFLTGFYVLQLKQKAEQAALRTDTRPVAPPVAGPEETVTLTIAYDDDAVFRKRQVSLPLPAERTERAREVLRALLAEYTQKPSPHPLAEGADIREVFLVGDLAIIDLSPIAADSHRSGAFVETLTLTSMIATLAQNIPGVRRVRFLVDGKERETLAGHADLMATYDVSQVDELVRGLQ
ncbi:MAG: GerMN domain-containing protein [Acidobacteriota bacterium]|nr:GerMN domain-containing protein [Acidobacteriota bacterium]